MQLEESLSEPVRRRCIRSLIELNGQNSRPLGSSKHWVSRTQLHVKEVIFLSQPFICCSF